MFGMFLIGMGNCSRGDQIRMVIAIFMVLK